MAAVCDGRVLDIFLDVMLAVTLNGTGVFRVGTDPPTVQH